ncbi:hypothetical protein ACQX0N_09730 [Clostridium tepidum]|nr:MULTISPECIES: hypothetical protein [Clostridium]MDU1421987.1 hypothetical protein [Clostridium botulinum]AKC63179.1 hypothetical protein CLSPO_c24590 [Clostridium sporogenes]KCZ67866.1 hypothetical protein CSPO_7c02090 [Clostridium sporogenes]MDU7250855.1 hypothetical protein [Clostridium sp.]NFG03058.1 hypothetical protein [Clostridium sporogenes]
MQQTYCDDKLLLIKRDEANQEFKNNCVKYVNDKIQEACERSQLSTDLEKKYLYDELLKEIKKEYKVFEMVNNNQYIKIAWD